MALEEYRGTEATDEIFDQRFTIAFPELAHNPTVDSANLRNCWRNYGA